MAFDRLGAAILATLLMAAMALAPRFPQVRADDAALSIANGVLYFGNLPFTGLQIGALPNGDVVFERHYRNGLLEGETREYGVGHKLREIWNFHAGLKDGLQRGWYLEGPKRFEKHFRNGTLAGRQTEWHQNGQIFRQQDYVDGVEVSRKIFFANAEIFTNFTKHEGRVYGIDGGALCMETKPEGER